MMRRVSPFSYEPQVSKTAKHVERPAGEFVQNVLLNHCSGAITVIKIIRENVLAVGYSSGDLAFFSLLEDFRYLYKCKEHNSSITAMDSCQISFYAGRSVQNKEVLLTGGNEKDMAIVVWDAQTYQPRKKRKGHDHMITSIQSLHDNSTIVTASFDSKIVFWDLNPDVPECIQVLHDMKFPVIVMEYDPDESILSGGTLDGQIGIWKLHFDRGLYSGAALLVLLEIDGHVLDILTCSALPGSILTLQSDFCIREYQTHTGKLLKTVRGDKPLIDLFIIESTPSKAPVFFAIDNANSIHKIAQWDTLEHKHQLPATEEADVNVKRYIGFNPKSQIFIFGSDLFLLTVDQINQSVAINKLNLN